MDEAVRFLEPSGFLADGRVSSEGASVDVRGRRGTMRCCDMGRVSMAYELPYGDELLTVRIYREFNVPCDPMITLLKSTPDAFGFSALRKAMRFDGHGYETDEAQVRAYARVFGDVAAAIDWIFENWKERAYELCDAITEGRADYDEIYAGMTTYDAHVFLHGCRVVEATLQALQKPKAFEPSPATFRTGRVEGGDVLVGSKRAKTSNDEDESESESE